MKVYKYPKGKRERVLVHLAAGNSVSAVATIHKIHPSTVYAWKKKEAARFAGQPPTSGRGEPTEPAANGHSMKDAIIYLKHAQRAMMEGNLYKAKALVDPICLYAMLALNTLEGRI